jgi:hypothetical protein
VFSGEDPQLWKSRCENYYEMYGVEESLWVRVALMHMEGAVAPWLQSAECRIIETSWSEFCVMIHDRFGCDQHEALIRQLFHIRQSGTVALYVEEFSALVDQLLGYEASADPLYYAMRFVDGLCVDIRSMVMIQRPSNLDSACALALVQEEAHDFGRKVNYMRYKPSSNRMVHRPGAPL